MQYDFASTNNISSQSQEIIKDVESLKEIAKQNQINRAVIDGLNTIIVVISITTIAYKIFQALKVLSHSDIVARIAKKDLYQKKIVEDILHEMRGCTNCDRVAIGMFFNGKSAGANHLPFTTMSLIYESCGVGIGSLKNRIKGIEIEKIEKEILDGSHEKFLKYGIVDPIEEECKQHLYSIGIKTIYSRLLTSKKNRNEDIYGIIQLHFVETTTINDEDMERLEIAFAKLNAALKYVLNNKDIPVI